MQILGGLCGKLFLFLRQNSKVKTKNDGWHVGCKRKGRREARSFRKGSLPGTGSFFEPISLRKAGDSAGKGEIIFYSIISIRLPIKLSFCL